MSPRKILGLLEVQDQDLGLGYTRNHHHSELPLFYVGNGSDHRRTHSLDYGVNDILKVRFR